MVLLYLDDSILPCHRYLVSMGEERDAVDQRLLCIEIYHPIIHPGARCVVKRFYYFISHFSVLMFQRVKLDHKASP